MQISMLLLPIVAFQNGGLKITDVKVGTGMAAQAGDQLSMDYTGTLMNGTVFDSSKGRTPFQFTLGIGQVIKGWDRGVAGMKVGGKRILVIPGDLAYGAAGSPPKIGPNATLKFVIELKGLVPQRVEKQILKEGHGAPIEAGDTITIHYKVMLKDGKKIESSYDTGAPKTVHLGQPDIIKGFTIGLLGMKQGEKRRVTIPYKLAFGEEGRPPAVPPKSDLVFEIELMSVQH